MSMRDDALVKATEAVVYINKLANINGRLTATVGELTVSPNKFSIVPGRVDFTVQVRDTDSASMDNFLTVIHDTFGFAYEVTESQEPITCDPALRDCVLEAAKALEVPYMELPSRAGHDAQVFFHCPMAMLFVPSRGGISHSPMVIRRISVIPSRALIETLWSRQTMTFENQFAERCAIPTANIGATVFDYSSS